MKKPLGRLSFLIFIFIFTAASLANEDIVENVQKAIGSRLYKMGRFSPTKEQGVHHFHSLLSEFI